MGASSFSPSPITTMPSMATVSSTTRMASTAAWSAPSLSPRPIHRDAASAAASVTRTSSMARLRSGDWGVLVTAGTVFDDWCTAWGRDYPFRVIRRVALVLGAVVLATGLAACDPNAEYDVAFFGDVPYGANDGARVDTMIRAINGDSSIVSSTHLGDLGPPESATCTNAWVDQERARMDTFQQPLVYTPGDNEWRDCSGQLTRLSYLRSRIFRGTGTESRGQTRLAVTSQADRGYPENARWSRGPVTFATLHVVGSRDNYSNQSEFAPRRQAGLDWVAQTFDLA